MKFSPVSFSFLAFVASASAQYFSEGWKPGQTVTTEAAPEPSFKLGKSSSPPPAASTGGLAGLFDLSKILTSEPLASLFMRAGVNISEKLGEKQKLWDNRIPLITDDNYNELIVNEPLTKDEESKRVWFIVITVSSAKQDGISQFLDGVFDSAYSKSVIARDLPHVRWGRIDYFNVTTITTKWAIWQAPYLVVLKDRGKTLRFYQPQQLKLREDAMREFLKQDGWKVTPPWSTAYAPGGSREYIMDYFAEYMTRSYNFINIFPRWALFLATGSIASFAINLLHRSPAQAAGAAKKPAQPKGDNPTPPPAEPTPPTHPSPSPSPVPTSPAPKRTSARLRKGRK